MIDFTFLDTATLADIYNLLLFFVISSMGFAFITSIICIVKRWWW